MFRNPLHLCLISPWRLHCGTDDFLVVPREWQPCWWGFPIDRWAMKSIYQLSGSNKSWVQGLQGLSVEVWSLLNSYSLLGTKLEKPLRLDLFLVEIGRTPKIWNTWTFFWEHIIYPNPGNTFLSFWVLPERLPYINTIKYYYIKLHVYMYIYVYIYIHIYTIYHTDSQKWNE